MVHITSSVFLLSSTARKRPYICICAERANYCTHSSVASAVTKIIHQKQNTIEAHCILHTLSFFLLNYRVDPFIHLITFN